MTKWEYLEVCGEVSLNDLGEQGWELVAVNALAGWPTYYFKRPQPSLSEQITLEQFGRVKGEVAP